MASNAKANESTAAVITDEDSEWMDGASATFPKAENLAPSVPPNFGPGRLVAIWAQENGTRKNDSGKEYPYVQTLTLVLDNGPDGNQTDDTVGKAPVRLEDFQHSTGGLVARLSKRVTGKSPKGVPLKYRPMIGRMNTQASSQNKNVAAFSISEPTAADMEVARGYAEMIKGINAELEAKDKEAENSAAFE
jgi:hypothetical protein